ncbi:hypothetical protein Tco_0638908, partial [Tanacetum coccineum]
MAYSQRSSSVTYSGSGILRKGIFQWHLVSASAPQQASGDVRYAHAIQRP